MKILFMGSSVYAPEMLAWTAAQPEAVIVGVVGDEELESFAKENAYPVYSLEEINEKIEQDPSWTELVLSFLYWRILKHPVIDVPRYGCINFHPAPLPDYRGRAGCSFAILDKLSEWGCTAHYVNEGIDTGDIIEVMRFSFNWKEETGISLKRKTLDVQCELYKKIISRVLQEGRIDCMPQSASEGRYISKQDMLSAMKISDKDDIDAKIQAFWFPPHEGAYMELSDGQRYTLVNKVVLEQLKRQ